MNKDHLRKIKLENKLRNWVQLTVRDDNEKQVFLEGLSNLSEKQLFQLVSIVLNNPGILQRLAKQAYKKNIVIKSNDKKAWAELLQEEKADLSKQLVAIMDEEITQQDQKKLDELRKSL
ncbi:hypothetical protein IID19_01440 [Patescibacteria group bacterium]|nr:hypothetical protein [Patescibacteria group bacterium]